MKKKNQFRGAGEEIYKALKACQSPILATRYIKKLIELRLLIAGYILFGLPPGEESGTMTSKQWTESLLKRMGKIGLEWTPILRQITLIDVELKKAQELAFQLKHLKGKKFIRWHVTLANAINAAQLAIDLPNPYKIGQKQRAEQAHKDSAWPSVFTIGQRRRRQREQERKSANLLEQTLKRMPPQMAIQIRADDGDLAKNPRTTITILTGPDRTEQTRNMAALKAIRRRQWQGRAGQSRRPRLGPEQGL